MTTESLLRLATAIAHDHPGDLHAQLYRLTALLDARDFRTLERELAQWRPQFERNGVYTAHFRRIAQSSKALQLSAAGRNAADLVTSLTSRRGDQPVRSRLVLHIFKYDAYAWNSASAGEYWNPEFLPLQTQAKVNAVFSEFMLLLGQRAPALQLVAANYRMGQLLSLNDSLICRLIGIAVRNIASTQLGFYTLNACETPAELSQLWQTLEMLNRTEGQLPPMRELLWEHEWASCIPEAQWPQVEGVFDDYHEALTLHGIADARFQLVRMAAATRGKQLMLGMLPRDSSDLGPLFLTGAPLDPFTSAPLHLRPSPTGVTCYSFGPDRADNLGAITYDPSNGTTSRGDITLEVPARRQYSFPRAGVYARSREDLLAQFPNGLPPDPFADTRGRPLGVTSTFPVQIYSFGPDSDESDSSVIHPEVAYDPTNGTSSSGDLFMQVPWR